MRGKSWVWVGAGALVILLIGLSMVISFSHVQQNMRYLEQRSNRNKAAVTDASFDALLAQARLEYQALTGKPDKVENTDYPAKVRLLQQRTAVMAVVRSGLTAEPGDLFYHDLLRALEKADRRTILQEMLDSREIGWYSALSADLRLDFSQDELREMALSLPDPARFAALRAYMTQPDPGTLEQFLLQSKTLAFAEVTTLPGAWDIVVQHYDQFDEESRMNRTGS